MNQVNELKAAAEAAQAAYGAKSEELKAAGLKSAERYEALKVLKAAADSAHAAYAQAAKGRISRELDKIIAAGRPAREAAARARSPWKQAKYDAGIK